MLSRRCREEDSVKSHEVFMMSVTVFLIQKKVVHNSHISLERTGGQQSGIMG